MTFLIFIGILLIYPLTIVIYRNMFYYVGSRNTFINTLGLVPGVNIVAIIVFALLFCIISIFGGLDKSFNQFRSMKGYLSLRHFWRWYTWGE